MKKEVARDISYSSSAKSKAGRAVIRSIENMTGRIRLIKKAKNYENEVALGRDFWEVILEKYKISLNLMGGSLNNIPKKGPVVVVANHPFGVLDGLVISWPPPLQRAGRFRSDSYDESAGVTCTVSSCN